MSKLFLIFLLPIALLAQTGASSLNTRQSGTGAISRSVESALNAFPANISSYGGDLQATICALPTAGGTVVIDQALTLTVNITACSKTSVIVRKLAGIAITGAYTVLGATVVGGVGEEWYGNTSSTPALSVPSLAATGLPAGSSSDVAACIGAGGVFHAGGCSTAGHAMVTVLDSSGCDPTGVADSTSCINAAVTAAAGGGLRIPAGIYLTGEIDIPSHTFINCDSGTTKLVRNGAIAAGHGWINLGDSGTVNVASDGITTTLSTGDNFLLLQVGDRIYINGVLKSVATLVDSLHITITPSTGGILTGVTYVSPRTGVTIDGCTFDGQVTTPTGFDRAGLGSGPLLFSLNSTLWLHGGKTIAITNDIFQHSGGWPAINDASGANIEDVSYARTTFQDNRSFLFGDSSGGSQTYGSWSSGILNYSYGAFFFNKFSVIDSTFQRLTGTGIFWDAVNGNSAPNRNIIQSNNHFTTIGLDGILSSGINGLTQTGNTFDGCGFVSTSDTDLVGTAKWYNGPSGASVPGVCQDTASLVINATITGNAKRINGGCVDGDGLGHSTVSPDCYNAMPSDPDYDGTVAAQMGPAVYGGVLALGQNYTYGFNLGNTNNTAQGASSVKVTGGHYHGMCGGSIRMYAARDGQVSDNMIVPCGNTTTDTDHNFYLPIVLGNTGTGPYQRAQNNTVTKNKITYAGSAGIFAVTEDNNTFLFQTTDRNFVYDDDLTGALAPFLKDATTSSVQYGAGSIIGTGLTTNTYDYCVGATASTTPACMRMQTEVGATRTMNFYDLTSGHKVGSIDSNGVVNAVGAGTAGFAVNATGVIGSAYDFFGHSLNVGTTPTIAASAAGLAVDNSRNVIAATVGIGTNPTQLTVIDAGRNIGNVVNVVGSGNLSMTGTIGAGGNMSTLGTMTVTLGLSANAATIGTGASSFGGNLGIGGAFSVTGNSSMTGSLGVGTAFSVGGNSTLTGTLGIGGTVNAGFLGALVGAGNTLCMDSSNFIRSSNCPGAVAPLVLGSSSFTGNNPLVTKSQGAFDNVHDYSTIVSLLGATATSNAAILAHFHPLTDGLLREGAVIGGVINTNTTASWESDAIIGMAIQKRTSGFNNVVAGSFFAGNEVIGGNVEASNLLVQDWDRTNLTCFGQYLNACHYAGTLIGQEIDVNIYDQGTNGVGTNYGVAYGNGHTTTFPTRAVSFNVTGCVGFCSGTPNYFDTLLYANDFGGNTFARVGLQHNSLFNSQFIDMISGSSGQYTARIYNSTAGYLVLAGNTLVTPNYVAVGPDGSFYVTGAAATVTGVASTPSIVATNGYMQSGDGFYTTSALTNALNIPNGGASVKNLAVTNTVYNSFQSSGGATLNGTIRSTSQTVPASGAGVELLYNGSGYLQAYNRSGSFFNTMFVDGSTLYLNTQTNGLVQIGSGGLYNPGSATIGGSLSVGLSSSFSNAVTFSGGIIMGSSGISAGGHSGYSGSIGVRSLGGGTCTLDFAAGIFYGSSGC